MSTKTIPAPLAAAGVTGLQEVDVRPVLEKGGDPFSLILRTVKSLGPSEALHLIVGFEPMPLYGVLGAGGFAHHTEQDGDLFHCFFYREKGAAEKGTPRPGDERVPLKPPVELDVRGLEPPQPMLEILGTLSRLGAGAQLVVRHHRDPVLLYDKLEARGYAARAERLPGGDFLVRIAPIWAFEGV